MSIKYEVHQFISHNIVETDEFFSYRDVQDLMQMLIESVHMRDELDLPDSVIIFGIEDERLVQVHEYFLSGEHWYFVNQLMSNTRNIIYMSFGKEG